MVQLLIVEDEKWEREGLRDFLDWTSMGIEVAGCACNGMDGVKMAEAVRPQIIITDIRMPIMDGLEMSRKIRAFLPDARIIILSGYDDFEYAKQTFDFNAFAYILKPVQKKELEQVLMSALEKLEEEKRRRKAKLSLESQWMDYIHAKRHSLLVDFLNYKTEYRFIHACPPLENLKASGEKAVAILSVSETPFKSMHESGLYDKFMQEVLRLSAQLHEGKGIAVSCGEFPEEAVICMDVSSGMSVLETCLFQIMKEIRERTGIQCIAGIGEIADGIEAAPRSYSQAREAIGFRFIADHGEMLFYSDIRESNLKNGELFGQLLEKSDMLSGKTVHHVQKGDMDRSIQCVDEFLAMLRQNVPVSKALLNRFVMGALNGLSKLMPNPSNDGVYLALWDPERHGVEYSMIHSFSQTRKYLTGFLGRIAVNSTISGSEDRVVRRVLEIIEERYGEELNLKRMSEEIHFSPYYIGSLFKEHTGKHFTQYLQDYRIDKAKEMLRFKNVKVSVLAETVGIPNPSYFCLLFKNKYGISPGEYMEIVSRGHHDV